jgi:hypothetical protein
MQSKTDHYRPKKPTAPMLALLFAINWLLLTACGAAQLQVPPEMQSSPNAPIKPADTSAVQASPTDVTSTATEPVQLDSATPLSLTESPDQNQPTTAPTQRVPLSTDAWKDLPIIPSLSDTARQIYQRGLSLGRNSHAFSKIGDCQNITTYFLALFDKPGFYQLGDQSYLQATIDWFSGSFQRESLAVRGGLNAAAMLSPLRADPNSCQTGESPLVCELRINNPSFAIISLEEWWADDPTKYEHYMRQIIEYTLSQDILPILATKADNLEGDHLINQTIAQLAWEYDLPLWNFWLAVQPLPNHGLIQKTPDGKPDLFHLTYNGNYYNYTDLQALKSGWAMRNLTALQVLDAIQRALNGQALP